MAASGLASLRKSRFGGDSTRQAFFAPRRRLRASDAQAKYAEIGTERLYFASTTGTRLQMRLEFLALVPSKFVQRIKRETIDELVVRVHPANFNRSCCNPVRIRVLIVPSGSPVCVAIS